MEKPIKKQTGNDGASGNFLKINGKGDGKMSNQVLETMKQRSSARAYSAEKLTKEELDSILEAGLQAPTGMNRQEIRFSVVGGDNPI